MVFYFTATGNSLYVAKQLDAAPMSIPQAIHGKDTAFRDGSIGVVCPIFGHEAPPMVKEFLKKCTFDTDYFYMVLTYGNRHGDAAELAQALCAQCGIRPAYINTVLMVDNFLPAFDMAEQVKLDKKVEAQIEAVKADIAARRRYIQPTTEADRAAHQAFLARSATPPEERWKNIYQVADGCVGVRYLHPGMSGGLLDGQGREGVLSGRRLPVLHGLHPCLPTESHWNDHTGNQSGRPIPQRAYRFERNHPGKRPDGEKRGLNQRREPALWPPTGANIQKNRRN